MKHKNANLFYIGPLDLDSNHNGRTSVARDTSELLTGVSRIFGHKAEATLVEPRDARIPLALRLTNSRDIYVKQRPSGNVVGIVCGQPPHRICAIAVTLPEFRRFKKINPFLNETLTTAWPGNPNYLVVLWFAAGDNPTPFCDGGSHIRIARGIVPVAAPDFDIKQFIVTPGPIPNVTSLKFPAPPPEEFSANGQGNLRQAHPIRISEHETRQQSPYWARCLVEKFDIGFLAEEHIFYVRRPAGYKTLDIDDVIRLAHRLVYELSELTHDLPTIALQVSVAEQIVEDIMVIAGRPNCASR